MKRLFVIAILIVSFLTLIAATAGHSTTPPPRVAIPNAHVYRVCGVNYTLPQLRQAVRNGTICLRTAVEKGAPLRRAYPNPRKPSDIREMLRHWNCVRDHGEWICPQPAPKR